LPAGFCRETLISFSLLELLPAFIFALKFAFRFAVLHLYFP
jgi:hypothetical protein